jgi:streptomycin 6-kinase
MPVDLANFEPWLTRWALTADGTPFETEYTHSRLLPVRRGGQAAMLKIATVEEERRGASLMAWWGGDGAAPVMAFQDEALLLARAQGGDDLAAMSRAGDDRQALEVLCGVAAALHRPRGAATPSRLPSLERWFSSLRDAASLDPRLGDAWRISAGLLADPRDPVVLHGDVHHGNVLDFGDRGWLAIDPKGLTGERAYDYANIFRNPDAVTALAPGRLRARLDLVARLADLEPQRLLRWVAAHAGLSAAWALEDQRDAGWSLQVLNVVLPAITGTPARRRR